MRNVINTLLTVILAISTMLILPAQQTSPASQVEASDGPAILQTLTGCLVRNDHGYSLMTETSSFSLETERNLEQYANKQVVVTGILEQYSNAAVSTSRYAAVVTDLRLRMIASVVGDCNRHSN